MLSFIFLFFGELECCLILFLAFDQVVYKNLSLNNL